MEILIPHPPLLTRAEEQSLAARVAAGDATAADELTGRNLGLVLSIAGQFVGPGSIVGLDLGDLFQSGMFGLIKAAGLYRPGAVKFSTYASYAIRRCIVRDIREGGLIRVPAWLTDGRAAGPITAGPAAVRRRAESVAAAGRAVTARGMGGRSRPCRPDPLDGLCATVSEDGDVFEDERTWLPVLLACLDDRQRAVIAARFGLDGTAPRTLRAVGVELGLTRERIRQIEDAAIVRLKEAAAQLMIGEA